MKNLILIFSLVITFSSCSQNDESKQTENTIYGAWKLSAVYSNIGNGQNHWNSVQNGYTILMNTDTSFESTKYEECNSGIFEMDTILNTISFIFNCNNFNPCEENSSSCVEFFSLDGDNLILSATYQNCDEGCPQFKFTRVK